MECLVNDTRHACAKQLKKLEKRVTRMETQLEQLNTRLASTSTSLQDIERRVERLEQSKKPLLRALTYYTCAVELLADVFKTLALDVNPHVDLYDPDMQWNYGCDTYPVKGESAVLLFPAGTAVFQNNIITITSKDQIAWVFQSPATLFELGLKLYTSSVDAQFMYESLCPHPTETIVRNPGRANVFKAYCQMTERQLSALANKHGMPRGIPLMEFLSNQDVDDPAFVTRFLTV
jgi:exonuclease VII small subunit